MIFNRSLRVVWVVLFVISLFAIIFFTYDGIIRASFGVISGILFTYDFIHISAGHGKLTFTRLTERKWHLFADFTQWLFWLMLLYIPFRAEIGLGYKIFFIVDLFIVATFGFYKFTNQPII